MRRPTNNRSRPRRRGFNYAEAIRLVRPELARQLVEPVEATLFDREAGGGAVRHLGHDRKHGQRQLHLWDWRPAGGDGVTIGFEIRPIDEPPRFPKLEAGFFIAPHGSAAHNRATYSPSARCVRA